MSIATKESLRDRLNILLSESLESVRNREQTTFEKILKKSREVVIYGAGNLGKKALRSLQSQGYKVKGFLDNNTSLHGKDVEGVLVSSIAEGWRLHGDAVGVVVAIYSGELQDTMSERIAPLHEAGFSRIAHFGHLAWKHPAGLLPHYSLDLPSNLIHKKVPILEGFSLFYDLTSLRHFVDHVEWRLNMDFCLLPRPVSQTIYFNKELLKENPNEFLIDGGAFTGDTLKSFLESFGHNGFYKALSFEPDPRNFKALQKTAASLKYKNNQIEVYPYALGDAVAKIQVESSGESSSRVGFGETTISCRMIDEFAGLGRPPTFIKLDIEGYELPALRGARRTISEHKPVLALSAYHKQDDLWELPLEIFEMQPEYDFRLVPHVSDGWDLVLYALPKERQAKLKLA
jgi:FkbM family methyltransferase